MGKQLSSICVNYKNVDGWHVFQSDEIHGLYVASKDARKSYDDVKVAIEKLIFLNENLNCTVQPELTFEEFISSMKGDEQEIYNSNYPIMSNKRYAVYASA